MSPIMELIKAGQFPKESTQRCGMGFDGQMIIEMPEWAIKFSNASAKALPDLQHLVEWVKHAGHLPDCKLMWVQDMNEDSPRQIHPCTCGRDEIQSLLGE